MMEHRPSTSRGYADHGWLQSFHSFSFAGYLDSQRMGWGNLRVINEDRIAPGAGFGTHSHRDMEIVSVVLSGNLAHRDSLGHVEGIPPGDIQRMSAGTGVQHSEFNHASDQQTHFLQIWVLPEHSGIAPGYEQQTLNAGLQRGALALIAARTGGSGTVSWNADACLYAGEFTDAESAQLTLAPGRKAYVHLIQGQLQVNGLVLSAGDALAIADERELHLQAGDQAKVLVFDLAP
jgi:quercetin 2,3-dioxygenase